MKHLILGFMFLFLASVATAQTETDWTTLLTTSGTKVIEVEGATKIAISTAKTLHERGVQFIDARGTSSWKYGHIPGALPLSYPTEAKLMEIVGRNEEVVFYCDCDIGSASCNLAPHASAKAVALGYQNVYYFTNSNEWGPAGYPIEKAE
jgi:rhodanese-related sulfurtransferase